MKNEIEHKEIELENETTLEVEQEEVYSLENDEELETLCEELGQGGLFFKPESKVSYKLSLTSPQVKKVKTNFTNEETEEPIYKSEFSIYAKGSDGSEFEGLYQTGKKVARYIVTTIKDSEESYDKIVFNFSKTGKGLDTEYNISKDFQ